MATIGTVRTVSIDSTPMMNWQWKQFLERRRDLLLQELADVEKQLGISPTTSELRKAFRDGRVMPATG